MFLAFYNNKKQAAFGRLDFGNAPMTSGGFMQSIMEIEEEIDRIKGTLTFYSLS